MKSIEHYREQIYSEIKQNKLNILNDFITNFINIKHINNDIDIWSELIIDVYLYSCVNGKNHILKQLLSNKIIRDVIPRGDVLTGMTLCLSIKETSYFISFIYLIDVYELTILEVNGQQFNMMQYCIIADNVDALNYLINRYDIVFDTMNEFQKIMLVMGALHNISRKTIEFLYETKRITTDDLNKISFDYVPNGIFAIELNKKYGYNIPKTPNKNINQKYVPPQYRKYTSKKTSYHIFNSSDMNRADKDLNWRHSNIFISP